MWEENPNPRLGGRLSAVSFFYSELHSFSILASNQIFERGDTSPKTPNRVHFLISGLRMLPIGGTITGVQKIGDFAIYGFELSREVSFLVTMGNVAIIRVAKGALV